MTPKEAEAFATLEHERDQLRAERDNYAKDAAWARNHREELERLREQLEQIAEWCAAYPVETFPAPDIDECRRMLGETLLSRLSAYNYRRVLRGVAEIARRKP